MNVTLRRYMAVAQISKFRATCVHHGYRHNTEKMASSNPPWTTIRDHNSFKRTTASRTTPKIEQPAPGDEETEVTHTPQASARAQGGEEAEAEPQPRSTQKRLTPLDGSRSAGAGSQPREPEGAEPQAPVPSPPSVQTKLPSQQVSSFQTRGTTSGMNRDKP